MNRAKRSHFFSQTQNVQRDAGSTRTGAASQGSKLPAGRNTAQRRSKRTPSRAARLESMLLAEEDLREAAQRQLAKETQARLQAEARVKKLEREVAGHEKAVEAWRENVKDNQAWAEKEIAMARARVADMKLWAGERRTEAKWEVVAKSYMRQVEDANRRAGEAALKVDRLEQLEAAVRRLCKRAAEGLPWVPLILGQLKQVGDGGDVPPWPSNDELVRMASPAFRAQKPPKVKP
jgi:hypothetical protein